MAMRPKVFSRTLTLTSTQAASAGVLEFGFAASRLWLRNDAAVSLYANLATTAVATTGDFEFKSSESITWDVPPLDGVSLITTSTGNMGARVVAFGGIYASNST